jgi:hypothetical protein
LRRQEAGHGAGRHAPALPFRLPPLAYIGCSSLEHMRSARLKTPHKKYQNAKPLQKCGPLRTTTSTPTLLPLEQPPAPAVYSYFTCLHSYSVCKSHSNARSNLICALYLVHVCVWLCIILVHVCVWCGYVLSAMMHRAYASAASPSGALCELDRPPPRRWRVHAGMRLYDILPVRHTLKSPRCP